MLFHAFAYFSYTYPWAVFSCISYIYPIQKGKNDDEQCTEKVMKRTCLALNRNETEQQKHKNCISIQFEIYHIDTLVIYSIYMCVYM